MADAPPTLPSGQWLPVRTGESGAEVFRRGDGAAFAKRGPAGRLRAERDRVAWLSGTGLPAATVLDWTESGGTGCLITSAVPGLPASDLPASAWPGVIDTFARTLRELHALPAASCPFSRRVSAMFRIAEDVVARGAVNPSLVVCHGDACLPNLLIDPDTLHCTGLIDLGRLGLADRYADLALAGTQVDHATSQPGSERLLTSYGLPDPDEDRLAFYLALDPLTWG